MLSVRGLLALVVIAALGYVALRLTWPADCEECSAIPEAFVLQGALALWLLVLVATVVVGVRPRVALAQWFQTGLTFAPGTTTPAFACRGGLIELRGKP